MDDKSILYDYLHKDKYMALATASVDGKPEVATVEYLVDGTDLLMNTFAPYRKYPNMVQNGRVAGVITHEHDWTLQFDGVATELHGDDALRAKEKLVAFDPGFLKFFDETKTRFFRIKPTWMRLRDYTEQPIRIVESDQL